MQRPAILFRGKVYTGNRHADALVALFDDVGGATIEERAKLRWAIDDGIEPIEFGYSDDDTYQTDEKQNAVRKRMYFGS